MERNKKLKCIVCNKIFNFVIDDFYNMIKCCSEKCFTRMSNKQHKEFLQQQIEED